MGKPGRPPKKPPTAVATQGERNDWDTLAVSAEEAQDQQNGAIEIHYKAEPTMARFHADDTLFRGIRGPVGSGKSSACCIELYTRALKQAPYRGVRRTRWGVIRNTYPELKTTTIKTWLDWFPKPFCQMKFDSPITGRIIQPLPDGTTLDMEIIFVSMDKEDDMKKLMSLEITGLYINEAQFIPFKIISTALKRVGRYPPTRWGGCTWRGIIADTNPPDDDSWWYAKAEVERPKDFKFFNQPPALLRDPKGDIESPVGMLRRNPAAENIANLDGGFDYYIRGITALDPEVIKAQILNEYASVFDGKPVYKDIWCDEKHVAKGPLEIFRGLPVLLGWDFGLTPACVIGQLSSKGQLRILREFVCERGGLREFAKEIVRPALVNEFANMPIISTADPAGMQGGQVILELTAIGELNAQGIETNPAATNNFEPRRAAVANFLSRTIEGGQPAFQLDPSCVMLRKGFNGGYHYRRMRVAGTERYKEIPEKNQYSHCFPPGTMVATPTGDVPIESISPGDYVITPGGKQKVEARWLARRDSELWEVELSTGRVLRGTPDHPVLTDSGWKRLDTLDYFDVLYSVNFFVGGTQWDVKRNMKDRSSMASPTTKSRQDIFAQTRDWGATSGTCIGRCGCFTTVQSPTGTISTTRTVISRTTRLRTLSLLISRLMRPCTLEKELPTTRRSLCEASRRLRRLRGRGMGLLKGLSFIGGLGISAGRAARRSSANASTAARRSRDGLVKGGTSFVPHHAKPDSGSKAALITSRDNAPSVGTFSQSISTAAQLHAVRIVGARRCQSRSEVWDLSVENEHVFFAEGVLVHNCHDAAQYLSLSADISIGSNLGHGKPQAVKRVWAI